MPEQPDPWRLVLEAISRVEQRMDRLVTTETHQADIRRIDERVADVISDVGQEAARRHEDRAEQAAKIENLRQALQAESENRRLGDERDLQTIRTELARERDQRKRDRQWLAMAIIGVLGLAVAAAAVIVQGG